MGCETCVLPLIALLVVAAVVLGLVTGVVGSLGRAGLEAHRRPTGSGRPAR